jgi:hypothetical protein
MCCRKRIKKNEWGVIKKAAVTERIVEHDPKLWRGEHRSVPHLRDLLNGSYGNASSSIPFSVTWFEADDRWR